jgi:hypothetical protein
VVFYINGKKDAEHYLGLGIPLDLDACCLGVWNNWANSPGKSFFGAIRDVRLYRGTLSEEQVADLFEAERLMAPKPG